MLYFQSRLVRSDELVAPFSRFPCSVGTGSKLASTPLQITAASLEIISLTRGGAGIFLIDRTYGRTTAYHIDGTVCVGARQELVLTVLHPKEMSYEFMDTMS